ncbi:MULTISPECIES: efflux RND transporter periplasmic adaptor subunit [Bacteroides]|uniref:efflux RND transporter periplasmic adaptor subunit n=1 Tax=Bacteroides TaxID=816 RepID=UPI001CA838B3|nr:MULTISPECIES: efflux RND transporter periplasmic adaptor subunit [Bacteroides]MBY2898373.1 RND transporter MFP subunit [Bacteroides fragilis]MCM0325387.1 efflux RND transporter periplasmic adaptor subunit [Bacteroides fragilis]MDV6187049.1 efflux RND transporter periplasmic adaptor subunit [Bacteroides hominis (ex Liu et al. 2022)]
MKKYIFIILAAAISLTSCDKKQSDKKTVETHQKGDGHNHEEGDGHNHKEEKNSGEEHSDEIVFTRQQADAIGLEVYNVEPGIFSQVIKTSGQIQSAQGDEATIVATTNGIVSFPARSIIEGAPVGTGTTIVTISARNLYEGDPVAKAKITYETALKEFKRAEGLVKDKIISEKEFEQSRLKYENARTAYEAQATNVTASGVKVTTPISGYIKNRLVNQGEFVSVGQPIATVSKNRRLQLRADVSENYFNELGKIRNANFVVSYNNEAYRLADLNGRLLSFGKAADETSFYIPVTFEFDNIGDFIPGSYVEVYLLATPQNNVISIPVSALTEEQGIYFVYLQIGEEEFLKREIAIGESDGKNVRVLSGLSTGDKVVIKGAYQVKLASNSSVLPEGHSH